jgi:hypothetical protein
MEKRQFAIPAIALGFTALTLTGCPVEDDDKDDEDEEDTDSDTDSGTDVGGGIDGSWSLTSLGNYGESYPLEYTYEYDGYTYTSSQAITMDIASPSVELTMTQSYYTDAPDGESYTDSYGYSGTVSDTGGGTYNIDVTDSIVMDCSLSGNSLSCVGTSDYAGLELEWAR